MKSTSLLGRLRASTAAMAVTVFALTILFFALANAIYIQHTLQRTLWGYSRSLADMIFERPDPELWSRIADRHGVGIVVTTPGGQRHAFDADGQTAMPEALADQRGILEMSRRNEDGVSVVFYWNFLHYMAGHWPILGAHLLLLSVVLVITYLFQRGQLRPLQALREAVESVARGNFEKRVSVARPDEIGQVADAFNQMTERVEQMMEDRERLLADVSHELRSPLTRIHVALELMPESEKRQAITRDLREMENLIQVLLERQRLRSRSARADRQKVDLVDIARRAVEAYVDEAPGVELIVKAEPLMAQVDPDLIGLLLRNLIDNAVKFSLPDSKPVEVELRATVDGVQIEVRDDGPGLPADGAEQLFEPFVKGDPARGHGVGHGLGLDLCRRIASAHGGSVRLEPGKWGGVTAVTRLPGMQKPKP